MNGIVDITVNGVKHRLRFNVMSCSQFERLVFSDLEESGNKTLLNLVYSGIYGENLRNELPKPDFKDIYDLVEALADEDDFVEQRDKVESTYYESKYGRKFLEVMEEFKKKIEAQEENSLQES